VTAATAPGLARAIEAAVGLQPFVEAVAVRIDPRRGARPGRGRFGYRYLTAEMLTATVTVSDGTLRLIGRVAYDAALRYPLMRVVSVRPVARATRAARRSARS
jgi:hypothetical protein